ncbi:MAG: autotransporter translocation and assembly factor TamB, partial [Gammaproteobacteria bacterium]
MKTLKYSFYTTFLLFFIFVYTVFYTTYGIRTLLNIADGMTEAKVSADVIHGSLYKGVAIRNLVFDDSESFVSVDELSLQWQIFALLSGRLYFPYITALNTRISLSGSPTNETPVIKDVWLPPLSIETLTMDKIVVMQADKTQLLQLDTLQFNLAYKKDKYNLQNVQIKNKKLAIYANGSVEFPEPFNSRLTSQIVVTANNKTDFTADL